MSPSTLVVAYFGIGVAGAALVIHRARRDPSTDGVAASAASALAMLILWPLWAPFAFAPAGVTPPSSDPIEPAGDDHPLVASIAVAFRQIALSTLARTPASGIASMNARSLELCSRGTALYRAWSAADCAAPVA